MTDIIALSSPVTLRANKQVGMFAVGTIDVSQPETIQAYGRGKKLELGIINITNNLYGTLGQNTGKFSHISGVVLKSQHDRLPEGLIINLIFGGIEASKVEKLDQEIELDLHLGNYASYKLNIEFNQSIKTQYGTTIFPPSILMSECTESEDDLRIKAYEWAMQNNHLIDPFAQYPMLSIGVPSLLEADVSNVKQLTSSLP